MDMDYSKLRTCKKCGASYINYINPKRCPLCDRGYQESQKRSKGYMEELRKNSNEK